MTSKDIMLDAMRSQGRADALDLRRRAADMDGTAIIREETKIPAFVQGTDYASWPAGSPVADDGQVWTLIQPYNSQHHPGKPGELRALWGLCHTKDPDKARAWVAPMGTSGMYMAGECYRDAEGSVWRCKKDNTVHDAAALPSAWEKER